MNNIVGIIKKMQHFVVKCCIFYIFYIERNEKYLTDKRKKFKNKVLLVSIL